MKPEEQNMPNSTVGGAPGADGATTNPVNNETGFVVTDNTINNNARSENNNIGDANVQPAQATMNPDAMGGEMNDAMSNQVSMNETQAAGMSASNMRTDGQNAMSGTVDEQNLGTLDNQTNIATPNLADTTFTPVTAGVDTTAPQQSGDQAMGTPNTMATSAAPESMATSAPASTMGMDVANTPNSENSATATNNGQGDKKKLSTQTLILIIVAAVALIGVIVLLILTNI